MYIYVAEATWFMQYNVYTRVRKEDIHLTYYLVKGDTMSLLQETCDAIRGRDRN